MCNGTTSRGEVLISVCRLRRAQKPHVGCYRALEYSCSYQDNGDYTQPGLEYHAEKRDDKAFRSAPYRSKHIYLFPSLLNLFTTALQNVFWKFRNCNPHEALSYDRLHAGHGGLFGRHQLVSWQECLEDLGRDAQAQVDSQ